MSYQKHLNSHKSESVGGTLEFMCDREGCGKKFRRRGELVRHLNLHDNNLEKCFFCPWGVARGQTNAIATHLNQHLGQANFECTICQKRFYRKISLKDHFESYHEKVEGKYKCDFCEYKTHARICLRHHIHYHHKSVMNLKK